MFKEELLSFTGEKNTWNQIKWDNKDKNNYVSGSIFSLKVICLDAWSGIKNIFHFPSVSVGKKKKKKAFQFHKQWRVGMKICEAIAELVCGEQKQHCSAVIF